MAEQWGDEESGCRCLFMPAMFSRGCFCVAAEDCPPCVCVEIPGDVLDEPVSWVNIRERSGLQGQAHRTIVQGKSRSFDICCSHDPSHSNSVLDVVQGEAGFRRASEKPGPTGGPP